MTTTDKFYMIWDSIRCIVAVGLLVAVFTNAPGFIIVSLAVILAGGLLESAFRNHY